MATFKNFEDIDCWQRARELTQQVYTISSAGRFARDFGLRGQIQRAAVSVMSNIAEGFERGGNREFIHFLAIAKGSIGEVKAQLYVALDQNYIDQKTFDTLLEFASQIGKMIGGLIGYLGKSKLKGPKFK